MASAASALIGSETASSPAGRPSTATNIAVRPSARSVSARAASGAGSTPAEAIIAALPSATRRPETTPRTPSPVTASKSVAASTGAPRLRAPATTASASGCSEARSSAAASPSRLRSSKPGSRLDVGQRRPPLGQRPRLVDHQRVDPGEALQRLGVADEHARPRTAAGGRHDRHRRRQPERAGTGDDQHRDRRHQRIGKRRRRTEQQPADEGEHGDEHHRRHEIGRHAVGQPLDRRPAALRLGDHGDDLSQHGLGAHLLRPHDQAAIAVERAAGQAVARTLVDRQRLPGDHRFVDR